MDSNNILITLAVASVPVIVQIISNYSKAKEINATISAHEQRQQDEIEQIKREMVEVKKRLDSHNGYAEKFAGAKKDIALVQKDVGYIKEQISNIQMCRIK